MDYEQSDEMKALYMTIKHSVFKCDAIHHSDRGLQCCSEVYQDELFKERIKPSMTDITVIKTPE
ncbi:conserved hypothetical protein [Pseudoalteromonas sp. 3J6]|nr:hypothetical protein [Pseudoalteromonas sp. 3J6]CAD2226723.1 conserved hypothetical protein [Pseudoalteromonas sp. 3J6]